MTDYKNQCNWRGYKMIQNRKKAVQAVLFTVVLVLIYGFVGYLEQEPPFDSAQGPAVEAVMSVAKSNTRQ